MKNKNDFITAVLFLLATCLIMKVSGQNKISEVGSTRLVRVVLPLNPNDLLERIVNVFVRQVQEHCEAKVITTGDSPYAIELALVPGIGAEGFRIEDRPGGDARSVRATPGTLFKID
jgi:hypothetical protein